MGWTSWWRRSSDLGNAGVSGAIGIDLNASRLRAMTGEGGRPRSLVLDEPSEELALAIAVDERHPRVGRPGLELERLTPHLACFNFLAEVNAPRHWDVGRQSYSASDLVSFVLARARLLLPRADYTALTLPAYLPAAKVTALLQLFERAKLPIKASAALPLALVAMAEVDEKRPFSVLIVDVDDHALTGSIVQVENAQARLLGITVLPKLNLRQWKQRLLNGFADRCVRVCRRDPRDSAAAEQALYEQIEPSLDRVRQTGRVDITVRSTHWYQNLILQTEDFATFAAPMIQSSVASLRELMQGHSAEPPQMAWLTHAAGRLPGLAGAIHAQTAERTAVSVLAPDAGVHAATMLAARLGRDEFASSHIDIVIPLPEAPARDASPPHYRSNNQATAFRSRTDRPK